MFPTKVYSQKKTYKLAFTIHSHRIHRMLRKNYCSADKFCILYTHVYIFYSVFWSFCKMKKKTNNKIENENIISFSSCGKKNHLKSHFINEINKIANLRTKYAEWSENTSVLVHMKIISKFSHSVVITWHLYIYNPYIWSKEKKNNKF